MDARVLSWCRAWVDENRSNICINFIRTYGPPSLNRLIDVQRRIERASEAAEVVIGAWICIGVTMTSNCPVQRRLGGELYCLGAVGLYDFTQAVMLYAPTFGSVATPGNILRCGKRGVGTLGLQLGTGRGGWGYGSLRLMHEPARVLQDW